MNDGEANKLFSARESQQEQYKQQVRVTCLNLAVHVLADTFYDDTDEDKVVQMARKFNEFIEAG